jgi:hypothetical protein
LSPTITQAPPTEIHLHLLRRRTFHSPVRQGLAGVQAAHKPLHRLVAAAELMVSYQILVNPLRR